MPFLVLESKFDSLKQIAELVGRPLIDLLEDCVVDFYVHVLPVFAVAKAKDRKSRFKDELISKVPEVTTAYDRLLERIPQKVTIALIFVVQD